MKLLALIKKEFHRFFHDPRLIITMLIPGLVIYILYTVLGNVIWKEDSKEYEWNIQYCGNSEIVQQIESAAGEMKLTFKQTDDPETAKQAVEDGEITALLVFSEEGTYRIYYSSANEESLAFYTFTTAVLSHDLSKQDMGASVMSGLLPFIVVIFIFSAGMSITLESVAGEKERGTLATVLVTSVKRSHVALGKIIPLSCIASIGAASSFLGVSLSMPKLMGTSLGSALGGFGFLSYFFMFLLILSVVPLITSLISLVSAYSKSVKEASAYTGVLMIFIMVLSLVSAFVPLGEWVVAVPVLNAVACMQGILSFRLSVWQSLVAVGINLVYTALLVLAVTKMLSSEKIMFGS